MPDKEILKHGELARGFVPEADVFQPSVSQAEGAEISLTRAGFMEAALEDPRVLRRVGVWIGLLREYAQLVATGAAPPTLDIGPDVIRLVRDELGLPWPWVAVDLLTTIHRMDELKVDEPVQAMPPAWEIAVLSPLFTIEVQDGDATDDVRAELLRALTALDHAEAAAKGKRQQKGPRGAGDYLRTWGRWYYEARVRRPAKSIRAIAAAHHAAQAHVRDLGDTEHHDDRKHVRKAIAKAERLLSLGAYSF